jgi:hypothetical protein
MKHTDDHDPVAEWSRCEVCHEALRLAFNRMADLDLSGNGSGELVDRLREIAKGAA